MSTFDGTSYYFSGQGVMMIGRRDPDTGNPIGLRPVGNVPDMKIAIATTVIEHKGSQDGQRATDQRLQTEVKVNMSATMESWSAANLAKALRGDDEVIAGGNAVNEAVMAFPGLVSGFRYIKVSAVVVKQNSTTLVVFTDTETPWDYKLNTEAGSILLNDGVDLAYDNYVPASPESAGDELTVSYTYAAQHLVDVLTQPLNDSWVRLEGLNTVDENAPVIVDIFRFSNDPLKELALLSDTFGQFVLEGSILKDDTRQVGSEYFSIRRTSNA